MFLLTVPGFFPLIAGVRTHSTVQAEFHITLACTAEIPNRSLVRLTMTISPFTVFQALTDSSGVAIIQNVPTGQYHLEVHRFNYVSYDGQVNLSNNYLQTIQLSQLIKPPSGLEVNSHSLIATWDPPPADTVLLSEDWSSGNFTTNQWTITGGTNWMVSSLWGHSPPSAIFLWSPQVLNYQQYLTSRLLPATYAANLDLFFETYLSNFCPGEYLSIEISNGGPWQILKEYSSNGGSWNYTTEVFDISAWSSEPIQIRFHAYGEDSYNINNWAIDNIRIVASGQFNSQGYCPVNYQVFVDNMLVGTTPDTNYQIQPNQVVYGVSSQVCVKAVFPNGISLPSCASVVSQYLYPPRNLQVMGIENAAYIQWDKPQLSNGTTPSGLLGYVIYCDALLIHTFNDPDSLSCYAFNLEPGMHYVTVNAIYDLYTYGLPWQTGYSIQAGPMPLSLSYSGDILPFLEEWNGGSFAYYNWTFSPSPGNWALDFTDGNAPPSAEFKGMPVEYYYSYALVSTSKNFSRYSCAEAFLDFDYKLTTNQTGSTEFLVAEMSRGGDVWEPIVQFSNSGNTGWVHSHTKLNGVEGLRTRFRFRAYGDYSAHIESWKIDNIYIYATCYPPELTGEQGNSSVTLSWLPPDCNGPGLTSWYKWDDGGAESSFGGTALQDVSVGNRFAGGGNHPLKIHEVQAYFKHLPNHGSNMAVIDIYTGNHVKTATSAAFIPPQNGWITLPLPAYLQPQDYYYVMVHYVSPLHASNPVGYDTSLVYLYSNDWAWVNNGGNWSKVTSYYNAPIGCFMVRVKATTMSDSPVSKASVGSSTSEETMSGSVLVGYNIYRNQNAGPFAKINTNPVVDTTYIDNLPSGSDGAYCYYVMSVFIDEMTGSFLCEASSDTLCYDFPVGISPPDDRSVGIYPNPVVESFTVEAASDLILVELYDVFGRKVASVENAPATKWRISAMDLQAGVYLARIHLRDGILTRIIIRE